VQDKPLAPQQLLVVDLICGVLNRHVDERYSGGRRAASVMPLREPSDQGTAKVSALGYLPRTP
jgi:hypothetical protein